MKKPASVVVFALVILLFVTLLMPKIARIAQLRERSENLEQQLLRLKAQNKAYETELRLLRDDPVYVEKVAREKLSKAKEGEIVYRVIRDGEGP